MLLLLLCGPVAADADAVRVLSENPALADFTEEGGVIEYLGPHGGLEGFLLMSADGGIKTIYRAPEGTMVMGILVDEAGNNVTAAQIAAYRRRLSGDQSALAEAAAGSLSRAERLYALTEKAHWVAVGSADAPYIYMYLNVNCTHCQEMFRSLRPAVDAGRIQLRLVPFGALPANRDGGAALLSAADPAAAWEAMIAGDGAALAPSRASADAYAKIDANTALAQAEKLQGPPFSLYRRPSDAAIMALVGAPQNLLALLADLLPPEDAAPPADGEAPLP